MRGVVMVGVGGGWQARLLAASGDATRVSFSCTREQSCGVSEKLISAALPEGGSSLVSL